MCLARITGNQLGIHCDAISHFSTLWSSQSYFASISVVGLKNGAESLQFSERQLNISDSKISIKKYPAELKKIGDGNSVYQFIQNFRSFPCCYSDKGDQVATEWRLR